MNKVIPRNSPGEESMTQGNVVKSACYIPVTGNLSGDESGVSDTAGRGTVSGISSEDVNYSITDVNQVNATRQPYLNIPYNEMDQRSPRSKGMVKQDVPVDGMNQYQ